MTFTVIMHEPISFPQDGSSWGWVKGFKGWAESGDAMADQTIAHAQECGVTDILWRGYSSTAPADAKWVCGGRPDGQIIKTGVRDSSWLYPPERAARKAAVQKLHDAGLKVWVHDGPSVNDEDAVISAYFLADDGVDYVVIDSSGNNVGQWVKLQKRELEMRGVVVVDEPVGDGTHTSIARVEARHFPWEAIEAGTVDPQQIIGWFNNPDETNETQGWIARCIQANLRGVCVPYPLLKGVV